MLILMPFLELFDVGLVLLKEKRKVAGFGGSTRCSVHLWNHCFGNAWQRRCYGLFRSIVLSLLIQTYPRRVFNYLRIICTTGLFTAHVYSHARTGKCLSDLSVI